TLIQNADVFISQLIDADAIGGITLISQLIDVNILTPETGDILRWNGLNWQNAKAYTYDLIWAEENGGIADNQLGEYSFGNGATGGATFGIPVWQDMEVVGMVANLENSSVGAVITTTLDGTDITYSITTTGTTTVTYFPTSIQATQGQLLNFRTITGGGGNDARVGAIIKQPIIFE
ncbi:MAG: hypothetical protein AAFO91_11885, partial [Bacteroidota bacterium]